LEILVIWEIWKEKRSKKSLVQCKKKGFGDPAFTKRLKKSKLNLMLNPQLENGESSLGRERYFM